MYNQSSPIQTLWQNTTTIQKFIIALIPIAILIIVIIAIISLTSQKDTGIVQITNFSEYSTAPTEYKTAIENGILATLNNNFTVSLDVKEIPSTIRQNTYNEDTTDNITTADFIVDIPSFEQSYKIEFSYSQTQKVSQSNDPHDYTVSITCPQYTDLIYDQPCRASANIIDDLSIYLPYTHSGSAPYRLRIATYNSGSEYAGQKYLSAIIYSCNDEQLFQTGKNEIVNWLNIRRFSTSDFPIEYTQACSQE